MILSKTDDIRDFKSTLSTYICIKAQSEPLILYENTDPTDFGEKSTL